MRSVVIVPTYNERDYIDTLLGDLLALPGDVSCIVPIVFEDRRHGTSKISRREVYQAIYTVLRLSRDRVRDKWPRTRERG